MKNAYTSMILIDSFISKMTRRIDLYKEIMWVMQEHQRTYIYTQATYIGILILETKTILILMIVCVPTKNYFDIKSFCEGNYPSPPDHD